MLCIAVYPYGNSGHQRVKSFSEHVKLHEPVVFRLGLRLMEGERCCGKEFQINLQFFCKRILVVLSPLRVFYITLYYVLEVLTVIYSWPYHDRHG